MRSATVWLLAAVTVSTASAGRQENRPNDVAVVKYARYERGAKRQKVTEALIEAVKACSSFTPDVVTVDIFLKKNADRCARYRRIVIPRTASVFSTEMYAGMREYVRGGGLLVFNESPIGEDINGNGKWDEGDKMWPWDKKTLDLIGTRGTGSGHMVKMKIVALTPITERLPQNTWIGLDPHGRGRTTEVTYPEARTLVVTHLSDAAKGRHPLQQPMLTYRRLGEGTGVYFVPQIRPDMDKTLKQMFKNLLNEKTLLWLTDYRRPRPATNASRQEEISR